MVLKIFFADGMKKSAKKFPWEIYRIYLLDIFYLSSFLLGSPRLVAELERVPKTPCFGYPKCHSRVPVPWRNGLKASWTRLFFIFCQIFAIFDYFSKWNLPKALWNFEKSSNMPEIWQKMKKSLVWLSLKSFFCLL